MTRSILVTGGAASGKSRFAVSFFAAYDYVLYLRMGADIDSDILNRIKFDNEKHGVEWDITSVRNPEPVAEIKDHKFVIFDSMSSYTRLVMKEMCPDASSFDENMKKSIEKRIIDDVVAVRSKVLENNGNIIVITLETGFSVTPQDPYLAAYREILGRVNQRIANSSDEVYFSASGIQFKIK